MMLNLRADEMKPGDVWHNGTQRLRIVRLKDLPDRALVRVYWSENDTGRPGSTDLNRDAMRMTERST